MAVIKMSRKARRTRKTRKVKPKFQPIKGVIVNYKTGCKVQYTRHVLVKVPEITNIGLASRLLNRKAIWISPSGKQIHGKVVAVHGKRGIVRVMFKRGLPGQAIGGPVEILLPESLKLPEQ